MNTSIVQMIVSVLISVWGLAMIASGVGSGNWVWLGLGLAVCAVGLPFVCNLWQRCR